MNNNIKDLFIFYFGPEGATFMASKGVMSKKEISNIISNYTLGEIKQLVNNFNNEFKLVIGEDEQVIKYQVLIEDAQLAIFADLASDFKNQIMAAEAETISQLTPSEQEIIQTISDIMYDAIISDTSVSGKDPLVEYIMKLKEENPELYSLLKTYRQYRQNDWTRVTSSAVNRQNTSDKIQALAASLINLKVNAFDHIASLQNNMDLKYQEYLKTATEIKENSSSVMKFLSYLLENRQTYSLNI